LGPKVASYITGKNAVKEILAAGGYTAVNSLGSGFNGLEGGAVDSTGNVFVADSGNKCGGEAGFRRCSKSELRINSGRLDQ
jgi:hypothetical protein